MTWYDQHSTDIQSITIVMPAIIVNIALYHCSVKSGKKHSDKIVYRLLKLKVNTEEENDDMYSTDDDSG